MEVMVEHCCGMDVHQKRIYCCVLKGPLSTNQPEKIQKTFATDTPSLRKCLDWLLELEVTHVFFESTGQYWMPIFNILWESDLTLVLANPQHIKQVPGRKTDVKDAQWIAELGRCGLIAPSYIPEPEVMALRQMTRQKRHFIQQRTQNKNQIHNLLQRSNIKLTSVLTDIFSPTGQKLLSLFINGETIDLESVSACLTKRNKATPQEVLAALDGKMSKVDRFLLGQLLTIYQCLTDSIQTLDQAIQTDCQDHFQEAYDLLREIPGVNKNVAAIVLSEIGPSVEAFETAGHLASWAGLAPGNRESAGIKKSSHTTPGNKQLKWALVLAGNIAGRSNDLAFQSFYHRLCKRTTPMKACVAVAHKLLRIIYKILKERVSYDTKRALGCSNNT